MFLSSHSWQICLILSCPFNQNSTQVYIYEGDEDEEEEVDPIVEQEISEEEAEDDDEEDEEDEEDLELREESLGSQEFGSLNAVQIRPENVWT